MLAHRLRHWTNISLVVFALNIVVLRAMPWSRALCIFRDIRSVPGPLGGSSANRWLVSCVVTKRSKLWALLASRPRRNMSMLSGDSSKIWGLKNICKEKKMWYKNLPIVVCVTFSFNIGPSSMWFRCWTIACDAGPTLKPQRLNVSWVAGWGRHVVDKPEKDSTHSG